MASIREIKNRIGSVKFTRQITKAMKMVAASKLRKSQNKAKPLINYSNKLNKILNNTYFYENEKIFNFYLLKKKVKNILIIVIASDRGLCGSYNSNVFRKFNNYVKDFSDKNINVISIGKKTLNFFKKKEYNLNKDYSGMWNNLNLNSIKDLSDHLLGLYVDNTYDKIDILYNEFKSGTLQVPVVEGFLPIPESENIKNKKEFYYEPSRFSIIEDLIKDSLKIQIYKSFLVASISEHSARMVAMSKATENAGDLLKDLKIVYNRSRQAAITKEMLEIVGGAEAISDS